MTACALCSGNSPRYDWEAVCCLARFVAGQPSQGKRRMWLDRIKAQQGGEKATSVEALSRELYAALPKPPPVKSRARKHDVSLKRQVSLSGEISLTQSKFKATDLTP